MTTHREPNPPQNATRRDFLKTSALGAAAIGGLSLGGDVQAAAEPEKRRQSMRIGFHTDAFNSSYWNFEKCLQWAEQHDVHRIECGVVEPPLFCFDQPDQLRRLRRYTVWDVAVPLDRRTMPVVQRPSRSMPQSFDAPVVECLAAAECWPGP